jgi:PAS domain-containing protein
MKERTIEASFLDALETDPIKTASEFYAARLPEHDKAVAFLADEFKLSIEQATQQQIGFSDRRLGKNLPTTDSQRGRDIRKQLKEVGLYKSTGHETLRGCVTFPLFDDNGNITGIYGRRIDRNGKGPQEITIGSGTREPTALAAGLIANTTTAKQTKKAKTETDDDSIVVEHNQIIFARDDRRYRVRGLEMNNALGSLKVNILVSRDDLVHLDAIDLVKARSRASFIKATAAELFVEADVIKRDIGQLLLKLESLQEQRIAEAKAPKVKRVELSEAETSEALALLRDPNLLDRIVADMTASGMVGESTNKLAGYLAATSRKLPSPLAIVIQSSSSAGKTSLMDSILDMMPPEETIRFSGMTGQSLFYLDSDQIKHNILAISEDEGIRQATYALKLLQSEGELRQATTARGSDGRMATETYHVEGPVQIMLTTTAMDIDEELVNRCLVLTVDETKLQTEAIHNKQRESFTTEVGAESDHANRLRQLHRNAQRCLRALRVYNPYATQLTFPDHKTRMRRDHLKYLNLINTIALLHQHQRKVLDHNGVEAIHVERSDIAAANKLAGEILGQSLDELAPQTRSLLGLLHDYVNDEAKATGVSRHAFRFTRRDVRQAIHWSDFQVHKHLTRLVDMEYVLAHRGKRGSRYVYELLYDGEGNGGAPFLIGLADPWKLKEPTSKSISG